jgi:hypothetical protein
VADHPSAAPPAASLPARAQKLRRTLAETDAEVASFRALFESFLGTEEEEWEPLVGLRRASLVPAFFEYLQVRISALADDTQEAADAREGASRRCGAAWHARARARSRGV